MSELLVIDAEAEGRDYSYARPSLAQLWMDGQRFIVRYVRSPFTHAKVVGPLEAAQIRSTGFGLVVVFELNQARPLLGSGAGTIDGTVTREYCQLLGQPYEVPVLAAVDFDTILNGQARPNRPATETKVREYLEGFSSAAGPYRWGVYGDYEAIDIAETLGSALNWQMGARSFSHSAIHPAAHVVQAPELWPQLRYTGLPSDAASDSNLALRPFLSWGPMQLDPPTPQPEPFPLPPYYPTLEDYLMSETTATVIRDERWTVALLVGAGLPEWITGERLAELTGAGVPSIVQKAHPSFPIMAARAGVPDLAPYATGIGAT